MRDDEVRARLVQINPWWRAVTASSDPAAWAQEDRTLRDRANYDLGYRSSILDDLTSDPLDDRLILLRGPRRVGKSVVLKDTALALCGRNDIDPRQIIYLPADGMSARDLTRATPMPVTPHAIPRRPRCGASAGSPPPTGHPVGPSR